MKTYKYDDWFEVDGRAIFVIRRPQTRLPVQPDELPSPDERIIVSDEEFTVDRVSVMGDSEFKWWPEFLIYTKV
jgi:hypothetical protein